jgi:hypothetical protein
MTPRPIHTAPMAVGPDEKPVPVLVYCLKRVVGVQGFGSARGTPVAVGIGRGGIWPPTTRSSFALHSGCRALVRGPSQGAIGPGLSHEVYRRLPLR